MAEKETKSGLFISGVLQGVDFTQSGKNLKEQMVWGASVKLSFQTNEEIVKTVNGVDIKTNAIRNIQISIDSTDDLLPLAVEKYNKEIGKFMDLRLLPSKNATFKIG